MMIARGIVNLEGYGVPEKGYCVRTDGEGRGIVFFIDKDETGRCHLTRGKGPISLKEMIVLVEKSGYVDDKFEWKYGTNKLLESGLLKSKDELYDRFN